VSSSGSTTSTGSSTDSDPAEAEADEDASCEQQALLTPQPKNSQETLLDIADGKENR